MTHEIKPGVANTAEANRLVYVRIAIVFLLVAIAGFSTLAKNSQYYSRSNPAHFLNISSKMKVGQAPAVLDREPLRLVARLVRPLRQVRSYPVIEQEVLELPSIGIMLTLQHRSPPSFVS